ncbi:serine/threonine protein kinase [Mycolicibacterium goodii]|uniref:serine/threonine-protein kinase n=1 Tax=Mycolicibacterium goodii TaxID=134601 RepID=UPI001BDD3CCB|nr:serine/threonine-protein kinase [Mycolicibacterium goodii]MBU8820408.1 serine/threonine protein kinase [Mycolicibacterium goodii]
MDSRDSRVGTRFGAYDIISLLGKGGMGSVYEARDTHKKRVVALKILADEYSQDPDFRTRFTREAHAAAELQEPHVIPIHDWGEINGSLYIDMRMVRGHTLRDLLIAGPLAPHRAVHIVSQVASALDAAHTAGLFHRDVKPENIIVTGEDDFAYLLDFGIAERVGDDHITKAGMTVGSMAYMAPERLNGEPTSAASDVYALACVLYETLTGARPFATTSMQHLVSSHLNTPLPQPSRANVNLPAGFDTVIERGMAKEPDDRYGSAGALARAATRALNTAPALPADQLQTMPGPQVLAATDIHTRIAPRPPLEPAPVLPPAPGGPNWMIIGVAAVVVTAILAIGLAVGMVAGNSSTNTAVVTSPAPLAPQTPRIPEATRTTTVIAAPPARPSARPPSVTGADANQRRCDDGVVHPSLNGPGTHAARGSTATSCLFTYNVLMAYWRMGPPDQRPRTVSAYGAVPCNPNKAPCLGDQFIMNCEDLGHGYITCTGGVDARVYIF